MDAKIMKDLNGKQLCIVSEQVTGSGYELKMFEYNQVQGFLALSTARINNWINYQYKVGDYEALEDVFYHQEMDLTDVKSLFLAISKAIVEAKEYLLNVDSILLNPQYIFRQGEEYYFCYYPIAEKNFQKNLRELMEYVLQHLNHEDQTGVLLAYGLYQKILRNDFTMESLMQDFYAKEDNPKLFFSQPKKSIETGPIRLHALEDAPKEMEYEKEREHEQGKEYEKEGKIPRAMVREEPRDPHLEEIRQEKVKKTDLELLEEEIERESGNPKRKEKLRNQEIVKLRKKAFHFFKKHEKKIAEEKSNPTMLLAESRESYGATQLLTGYRLVNEERGMEIPLVKEYVEVGKKTEEFPEGIDNVMISRHHAIITRKGGNYYVEDQGSTNGTAVNGARISEYEPVLLREGDTVTFANEHFLLLK